MKRNSLVVIGIILCVASFLAIGLHGLLQGSASASQPCTAPTILFDGTEAKFTQVVGVSASLDSIGPPLCGNAWWSDSSYWVLLGGNAQQDACALAQAGLGKSPNLAIKVFAEYGKSCNDNPPTIRVVWGNAQAGTHKYQVKYNANKHKAIMRYDGLVITRTNFDPAAVWGAQPWDEEWNAEVHDPGDDVPGTAAVPEFFSVLRHATCQACAWEAPVGLRLKSDSDRYDWSWDTNEKFHIWTK
ncbi:MAG: hypothetical protein HY741_00305 [Chloroflexi bacterium]|nr:hypothetical protein [Chloroflexota bacterium]